MVTRNAARQRGRATPTVAAVMIGTGILRALLVPLGSDARFREINYHPSIPTGTGSVQYDPGGTRVGGIEPAQQIQRAVAGVSAGLVVPLQPSGNGGMPRDAFPSTAGETARPSLHATA